MAHSLSRRQIEEAEKAAQRERYARTQRQRRRAEREAQIAIAAFNVLRKIKMHEDASINCLVPYLKCLRCQPDPPLPYLIGLRKWRTWECL